MAKPNNNPLQLRGIAGTRVLVTGAAGGIGQALVRVLSQAGAQTVATDLSSDALAALDALENVTTRALDVRDSVSVDALVDAVEHDSGAIDHCVNVAGILRTGLVTETDDQAWEDLFAVNARGVFNVARAVARKMRPRGHGNIVAVASNAAGVPRHGMAAYAASKAAATMLMRSLGLELGRDGIRCNIVAPGSTMTPMQTGMWRAPEDEQVVINGSIDSYKNGIPLGRIGAPEDVAHAVLFLLSEQARQITMADVYVDGGATQRA